MSVSKKRYGRITIESTHELPKPSVLHINVSRISSQNGHEKHNYINIVDHFVNSLLFVYTENIQRTRVTMSASSATLIPVFVFNNHLTAYARKKITGCFISHRNVFFCNSSRFFYLLFYVVTSSDILIQYVTIMTFCY